MIRCPTSFIAFAWDAKAVHVDPEFSDPGMTNESGSRKFCDISHAT
jgi:hypothetical protein